MVEKCNYMVPSEVAPGQGRKGTTFWYKNDKLINTFKRGYSSWNYAPLLGRKAYSGHKWFKGGKWVEGSVAAFLQQKNKNPFEQFKKKH